MTKRKWKAPRTVSQPHAIAPLIAPSTSFFKFPNQHSKNTLRAKTPITVYFLFLYPCAMQMIPTPKPTPSPSITTSLPYNNLLPSSTPLKLLSQSPQYPFTHSSTWFPLPCFAALSSSFPTLLHLWVSSRSQFAYSASTTSFSMRLTTRRATRRSWRWDPRF